ncbi:Thiamine-monophosphate kinase [Planctomycetes bacterium Pan216]|uniref:Thiamine-monophosphate kinase n=1 Tax=Kolteria novifilia TaxID=2527975 RepID=A0A518B5S7_9BACT|nr:Thiamine-monophosphate kinase [Planctomycetes bacterium Pan216]
MARGEWDFIAWLREKVASDPRLRVGIGDDTAVVTKGSSDLVVTCDMLVEGVHFDLSQCTPADVGRKAMNVNLSDIAAMAAHPRWAVVAVALPRDRGRGLAEGVYEGLSAAAERFGVTLIGGDTNSTPNGLVVSVTLIGEVTEKGAVLRSGAKPGDVLCVTGPLGYSLDGKHLAFTPRVREALLLHERYELHAMIDLSDGLASDLFHLTDESGCGAILEADAIPIRSGPADDRSPLEHALGDGEDFELLFALAEEEAKKLLEEQPLDSSGTHISEVGKATRTSEVLLRSGLRVEPLRREGFVHRW